MYLEGSEYVTYTPVEAYGVSTYDVGIVSGGGAGDATVVGNTRFYWVYNPGDPSTSGFSGKGWFAENQYTPLNYAGITEKRLIYQFENENRTNLNDIFLKWQELVDSQIPEQTDYVREFIKLIGWENEACYTLNG